MNYENYKSDPEDVYDECIVSGICSISPTTSAVKSLIFAYLQELAFYIRQLTGLGINNEQAKNGFIEMFSTLIPNSDYSNEDINYIVPNLHKFVLDAKVYYKNICEEKNVQLPFFKSHIKLGKDFGLMDIVKQGQKYSDKFRENLSEEQQKGFDIVHIILKSICIYIVELQELGEDIDEYYEKLLLALDAGKLGDLTVENIKSFIKEYSQIDNELMQKVFDAKKRAFGDFVETEVLMTPRIGKAILVAGSNLKDLERILEATKDKDIDVYTHGQMITAHIFSKFKSYPHLVGHYGQGADYYISDFLAFPGSIFLTKLSPFRVGKLCSCRFFTTDKISPQSVTQIKDYNFDALILSASRSDGFEESEPEKTEKFGIIEKDYLKKISDISDKIEKGEIKHIIAIGVPSKKTAQVDYFKDFLNLLPKTCFVITFYYKSNFENILFNRIDYAMPYVHKALELFLKQKQKYGLKINVLCSKCEPHSISNFIYMRNIGLDKLYFHSCPPNVLNPSLMDMMRSWYDISEYTTPANDVKAIIGE